MILDKDHCRLWMVIKFQFGEIIEKEFDELYDILSIFYGDMVYDFTH